MTLYAKLWCDILDDPKLIRGVREGAKQLQLLPWLIAFAKRAEDNGRLTIGGLPADPKDVARSIPHATPKSVTEALESLLAIGILAREQTGVGDVLIFVAWETRSETAKGGGARTNAEKRESTRLRVAKHRAKQRGVTHDDVTPDVTHNGNGVTHDVTPDVTRYSPERDRATRSGDLDLDLDLEQEREKERNAVTTGVTPDARAQVEWLAAEPLIGRLGGSARARTAIVEFLEALPRGQTALKWIALLDKGLLDGLQMPGQKPARPEHLIVALEQWALANHAEYPLSAANIVAFVGRVQRGELRAQQPTNGRHAVNGTPSTEPDLKHLHGIVEGRRQQRDGEEWYERVTREAQSRGIAGRREIIVYAAEHV